MIETDLQNSTSENGTTATSVTTPVSTTETVPTNSQANGESAPVAEETFTKVDPRNLPPQLRETYNNMLKDYKEKTTRLSETVKSESAKAAEAYKQKAELYDKLAEEETFVKQWNEYVEQKQNQPAQNGSVDPALKQVEAKINELNQKMQIAEVSQVTEAFADAVDEKGVKIHPDFDHLNTISIGQMKTETGAEEYSLLRASIELAEGKTPLEKLANGYKNAKALHDKIFEMGKKAGMGRLKEKALNGTQPPASSTGDLVSTTEKKPRSAREALDLARRGIMVTRD